MENCLNIIANSIIIISDYMSSKYINIKSNRQHNYYYVWLSIRYGMHKIKLCWVRCLNSVN